MFLRWVTIGLVLAGSAAQAADFEYTCLNGTVKELAEVRQVPNTEVHARCFRFGRMQSFNDVLAYRESRLSGKTTDNPAHQARCIFEAQQMHLSVYTFLTPHIDACDPDFLKIRYAQNEARANKKSAPDVLQLMSIVNRELKKLRTTDAVVRCFNLGRLGYLVRKFEDNLIKSAARGERVSPEQQARANAARRKVLAEAASCNVGNQEAI